MNKRGAGIFDAVNGYIKKNRARFHMPGHKGVMTWTGEAAAYDITEVDGCDSLYQADSAIAETERRYSELYHTTASILSAGGSTLCIQTMLALAVKPRQKLICGRGCHGAAINAMALLDITPIWIFPEPDARTGLAKAVTVAQVSEALEQNPDAAAVYITSPDYFGTICDIRAISEACRERGVPLLVDNAHGAHLRFLEPSKHPVDLGADMCCDSLHKTLPVLTGGAVLHIKNEKYTADAKRCMSVFGSTSPSYLILISIDKALESLFTDFPDRLDRTVAEVGRLEAIAKHAGFLVPDSEIGGRDPARLTLGFSAMGYSADEFARLIRESGIEPELISESFAVLMASPWNSAGDFARLEKFITGLARKAPLPLKSRERPSCESVKRLREAVLADAEEIPLDSAVGRVSGSVVSPCPPGIPLTVPGEAIDANLMLYLKSYGISHINVLK